jgi:hypothetical protein
MFSDLGFQLSKAKLVGKRAGLTSYSEGEKTAEITRPAFKY